MTVTFDHRTDPTDTITTFYFKPETALRYMAGQFIELTIPHDGPDERGDRRWFTLSSSPTESLLSITTKRSPEKGSSFKAALWSLEAGATLNMSAPMGDFVLPKQKDTPAVFVAGGMGITPMRSMLRWLADTGERREIRLLYAVRNEDDIIFQDDFEAAGVHATIVVSQPAAAWGGERGHLSAEQIIGLETPHPHELVYLSGPEPMIEQLFADLQKQGLKERQLVTDYFPGYEPV